MSQTVITTQVDGSIAQLVISNPNKRNALPQSGWLAIPSVLNQLIEMQVRVIIVRGHGGDFCAGADISEFDLVRKNEQTARIYEASNVAAFDAIRSCPVPTIAMIQGNCLGGGFGLAAACDLRIATPDARFSVPAARLGLGYPVDTIADITEAIGVQNTKQLLYTAEVYSGKKLMETGFLMEIVETETILNHTCQLALRISDLAPLTHQATKAAILAIRSGEWESARRLSDATFSSSDYAEGRKAFREKRKPVFRGS